MAVTFIRPEQIQRMSTDDWILCETPAGTPNGVLTTFTTLYNFVNGTTCVYLNGIRQSRVAGVHYTEIGTDTLSFTTAPITGDLLTVDYVMTNLSFTAVGEVPTGDINSVNLTYTTAYPFRVGSTMVYLNGVRQQRGYHYTESGTGTLLFTTAPVTGDILFLDYLK